MKKQLLLLHGALGSKKQFATVAEKLANHFQVFTMDFEGHGDFISENDFSMKLFTQNVLDFLDKNSIDSIPIFGYSMGGYVALKLAAEAPERVQKIVTLGTKFDWNIESAKKEASMLIPEIIEKKVPHFAQKLANEHHPQDWKNIVRKTAKMMIGLAEREKFQNQDLEKINIPVLIGIGSKDRMVSFEESEAASKNLPQGQLSQLENVPHPIEKVDPDTLVLYLQNSINHS